MSDSASPGLPFREIAASAYRAYAASTGNKNFRGEPMPAFDDLPIAIQTAWEAALHQAIACNRDGAEAFAQEPDWAGWLPQRFQKGVPPVKITRP